MIKRNTKSKQAVIDFLKKHDYGLKPDDLIKELAHFDKVTIYRILQSFLNDGIIHKAISDDGISYYFICKTCKEVHFHNHYHFKCSVCEKVECINDEIEIKLPKNYKLENINFWITGICNNCNKLKSSSS
ncbi:transcriptional repressor [Flavobacterium sp. HXWNR69]|uniref:Transcriptional repressor n=1 Tax=Flavobacterium fragile TaxID=2949085 RepID=A0ABT0THR9_9FLAO|nr:transcriptional repressor [Flavobacterium sp. HXWNR69]MCL9770527.1 transcriptional repressor [Flavobacterium sp. HXWNR69]